MIALLLTMVSSSPTAAAVDNIQVVLAVDGQEQGRRLAEDITCNEGEILLDISATTGDSEYYDWQVVDEKTGEIVVACPPVPPGTVVDETTTTTTGSSNLCYWTPQGEFHDQVCVPAGCSRFVTGEHSRRQDPPPTSLIEIRYADEEPIILNERFNSLQLTTSGETCETECSFERELELFLFYEDGKVEIETENSTIISSSHDWMISKVDSIFLDTTTTDSVMEDTTTITVQDGSRPRTYYRQCIDCLKLLAPSGMAAVGVVGYLVRAGGIIYGSTADEFATELIIGDCTTYEYCSRGTTPLQLDIVAPSSQVIDDKFYPYFLYYSTAGKGVRINSWIDFNPILLSEGVHYRRWFCHDLVDEDNKVCMLMKASPLELYPDDAVQVDGRTVEDLIDCSNPTLRYKSLCKGPLNDDLYSVIFSALNDDLYFALNGNCKSNKPVAWISTSVVAVFLLVGIYMYRKKTKSSPTKDTTSEGGAGPIISYEGYHIGGWCRTVGKSNG